MVTGHLDPVGFFTFDFNAGKDGLQQVSGFVYRTRTMQISELFFVKHAPFRIPVLVALPKPC